MHYWRGKMAEQKIPKIIHFCWFGGKEKPSKVRECIESWHKYLSDYEFMEWNESNFDINSNEYVKQAYEEKKFAYVSDYARIKALYQYGGIYICIQMLWFISLLMACWIISVYWDLRKKIILLQVLWHVCLNMSL